MPDADAMIDMVATRPDRSVVLADYDGSLSPIVELPDEARALPSAIEALRALVGCVGRVGIVSGRPVEFLAEHVAVPGVVYAGLYGMEVMFDGERRLDPRVLPWCDAVAAAAAESERRLEGVLVERKAGASVTLHWRTAPARERDVLEVAAELAREHGLSELRTRYAVELRPPVPIDKGSAIDAFVDGFEIGVFAGDDTGDLAAFAALARAQADGRLAHAVRIGVQSIEMPLALPDSVDFLVDGPAGLAAVLTALVARLAGGSAAG